MQEQQLQDISKQWLSALDTAAANSKQKNNTATNDSVPSTGIKFSKDINNYSYDERKVIDGYMDAVDDDILLFYNNAINKIPQPSKINIGKVTPKMSNEILEVLGVDTSGWNIKFEDRMAKHIHKDHGVNGITDNSMADSNDIARMKFIIENHDYYGAKGKTGAYKINVNGRNKDAPTITFAKKINGTYYLVVAVPKNNTLWITTAFLNKKIEAAQFRNASNEALRYTAKTDAASTSTDNVPQNDTSVNNNYMQGETKYSYSNAIEDSTKFSIDVKKRVAKNNRSVYNEFNTLAMQWAYNNNTKVGDVTILNKKGKGFVLLEATDDGYIEIASGKYKDVRNEYERTYKGTNNEVYVNSKVLQANKGRDIFNNVVDENRGHDDRNSGSVRSERLQNKPTRNNEHLRTGDKETSERQYSIDVEREIRQLRKQNEQLEIANEKLKQEFQLTHGRVTDERSAKSLAIWLKKQWQTAMSNTELADELVKLSNDGANGGYATYDDLYDKAHVIANKMLDAQKRGIDPEAKEILKLIKDSNISLSDVQKSEAAYYYDSYNNFRTSNFGNISITNKGTPR